MKLKIRGQNWHFVFGRPPLNKCVGLCVQETRTIYVRPSGKEPLGTTIHEILHAAFPDLTEAAICETENALMDGIRLIAVTKDFSPGRELFRLH